MATRKGMDISGTYAVPHKLYAFFISVLCIFKLKGWTKSYFICF